MMNKSFKEKEIKRWWDAKRQLRWKNIYNGEGNDNPNPEVLQNSF